MVAGLTPALRAIRQKEFYEEPRFHTSIAWALLDGAKTPTASSHDSYTTSEVLRPPTSTQDVPTKVPAENGPVLASTTSEFPTIPRLPPSLVPQLQEEFRDQLIQRGVGGFEAEEVHVRIGKEVSKWRLSD